MIGKENQKFNLKFKEDYFKPIIIMEQLKWYWKYLGFSYKYKAQILSNPTLKENKWSYNIKLLQRELYWLEIKLKTKDLS